MHKQYRHIIFDLDHTLWDFEKNSDETLTELYQTHKLEKLLKIDLSEVLATYREINLQLWHQYNLKKVSKEQLRIDRFNLLFHRFNYENRSLAKILDREYLATCPNKVHLIPGTIEVLSYLKNKYQIHYLTNGFKETQIRKITASKIDHFAQSTTTPECAGYTKPDKRIFQYKLKKINASCSDCLMVGDNPLTDVTGAKKAGIDQVFFNPNGKFIPKLKPSYEIQALTQLMDIL